MARLADIGRVRVGSSRKIYSRIEVQKRLIASPNRNPSNPNLYLGVPEFEYKRKKNKKMKKFTINLCQF